MHLRVITSRNRPFCKYNNVLCLGVNLIEAIHMELIGRGRLYIASLRVASCESASLAVVSATDIG